MRSPGAVRPRVWTPPPAVDQGEAVDVDVHVVRLPGESPEDVLVDSDGSVLTGLLGGQILRVSPDGRTISTVAETGGRPLGLEWLPDRSLLVCDALRGLLEVDASGNVQVLVDGMNFCNNAAVAADGTIYFTDSSQRFGVFDWKADLLEHGSTGRLLRRTPDGTVDVLASDLTFPNGVALSSDESRLFVAETANYRMLSMELTGDGTLTEAVMLPGFPDNIARGSDGLIWVAIGSPRDAVLDFLSPRAPVFRKIAWALPDALRPQPKKVIVVQAYDVDGRLVHNIKTKHPDFYMPTGVREHDGRVWLGSLLGDHLAMFTAPGPTVQDVAEKVAERDAELLRRLAE